MNFLTTSRHNDAVHESPLFEAKVENPGQCTVHKIDRKLGKEKTKCALQLAEQRRKFLANEEKKKDINKYPLHFYRLECLKLIQNGMADFAPFEPEDMYIAAKFMDDSMAVFLEMRSALTQLGKNYINRLLQ